MAPISTLNTMTHSDVGHTLRTFDLPVIRKGHFFQDSFFENAHDQFNSTVRQILQRWGETDFLSGQWSDPKLRLCDTLRRYRQLRTHNLKEEDQAVTVTTDGTTHKIVMDVHDFVNGEVKVKVSGEREVVVEGRTETKNGGWSVSCNSFRRRFCLPPHADLTAVSAVLSDDGILTVSAPTVGPALEAGHTVIPITLEGTNTTVASDKTASVASTSSTASSQGSTCHHEQQTQSDATQQGRSHIIPIQLDATQETSSCKSSATESTAVSRDSQNSRVESAVKNISQTIQRAQHVDASSVSSPQKVPSQPLFVPPAVKGRTIPINTSSLLPITRRGRFFDDDFFTGMRRDFQGAMNDVLGRWGEGGVLTSGLDALSSLGRYRQLRERNLNVESQAVTVTADQDSHKIVMDVNDFVNGEVKVKMAGEREVVVEGRTETKDGDWSVSCNSFRRRFCLPQHTDVAAVSAVLSDDGILTVSAPKKKQLQQGESTIPIKIEGQQEIKIEGTTTSAQATPSIPATPSLSTSQQSTSTSTHTDTRVSESVAKEAKQTTPLAHQASEPQPLGRSLIPGGINLPITTRGLFFGDSFFKNTWQDFQEAVRDVMSRWGNFSVDDDLTRYSTLRTGELKDENQAIKSTEDESSYKIVVDVQDFTKDGNITVKSVHDRELVVEGHVETQEGGAKYKKQFQRRFVLPHDIYPESVSSVMSADGVLTITAPKRPTSPKIKEFIVPVAIEEGVHRTESLSQVSQQEVKSPVASPISQQPPATPAYRVSVPPTPDVATSRQETLSQTVSSDSSKVTCSREHIIPLEVEQGHPSGSPHKETTSLMGQNTQTTQADVSKTVSETHRASEVESRQTTAAETHQQKVAQKTNSESLQTGTTRQSVSQHSEESRDQACSLSQGKVVPISLRGAFFSDSFFDDTRKRFAATTKDVMQHSGTDTSLSSRIGSHHSLLQKSLKLENQTAHVVEDAHSLKIILEVSDFIGGELKVEVEGGRSLVVEGQTSCEEGTSSSTRNFRRVFSLPSQANVEAISSALSSDGVLTITTPKLQQLVGAASNTKEMTSESHSRQESKGAGAQAWEEKKVKEQVKESEGCSSKSYSSSYSSHQQYSSQN